VQADLKTFESFGVGGAAVVTAITAQTATDVLGVSPVTPGLVAAQLEAVLATVTPRVVKCGMLGTPANVAAVANVLVRSRALLVVDPVIAAGGGAALARRGVLEALVERLFPRAAVVTVNLSEAEAIVGAPVGDESSMARAAAAILALGPRAVVLKGGHLAGAPVDLLLVGRRLLRFRSSRVAHGMHGTGCAFASAVAAGLALDRSVERAVSDARSHVRALLRGARRTKDGGWVRA
jgi:hydroxymethylpyrimidine/phosphomethylpyrimidine kinase